MTLEQNRLIVKSLKWVMENHPELSDKDAKKIDQIIGDLTFESGVDWDSDFNTLGN